MPDGSKEWFLNGVLHRENGPAVEWSDGHEEWFLNGKRHREDGPAVEYPNGTKEWHLNNISYTKRDYLNIIRNRFSRTYDWTYRF